MEAVARWAPSTLTIELTPEVGDPELAGHARLIGRAVRFVVPAPLGPEDVHPDVEALVCVLVAGPWSASLRVARPVSPDFADAVRTGPGIAIGPVDPALAPRRPPADGVVALAYSGGPDSTAAYLVLPPDTVACFMRRIVPPGKARPSIYRDDAAMHACAELERRGRQVRVVESDVEHARDPIGFPTTWVTGAGPLLLADRERFNALGWGVILESGYHLGHERSRDWAAWQRQWGAPLAVVGLPMCHAAAGVSQVAAAAIVRASPYADLAQSCIRGTAGVPCGRCWKCFRKTLLDAAHSGAWPADRVVDRLLAPKEVRSGLAESPIKHEDVFAWAMARYRGTHPVLRQVARRTRATELDLDWLTRFYGPAVDTLPEARRADVRRRLEASLRPMSPEEEARVRAWDMGPMLADSVTVAEREALVAMLGRLPSAGRPLPARILRRIRRRLSD